MPPVRLTKINLKMSPGSFGALHTLSYLVFIVSRDTEEVLLSPSYTSDDADIQDFLPTE